MPPKKQRVENIAQKEVEKKESEILGKKEEKKKEEENIKEKNNKRDEEIKALLENEKNQKENQNNGRKKKKEVEEEKNEKKDEESHGGRKKKKELEEEKPNSRKKKKEKEKKEEESEEENDKDEDENNNNNNNNRRRKKDSDDEKPEIDEFYGWTSDQIVQHWRLNPPETSKAFPETPKGIAPFSGSHYGSGIWKFREKNSNVWAKYSNYDNAVIEYNYQRGVRRFICELPRNSGVEYEVSFDHRSQREVKDHSKSQLIERD